MTRNRRHQLIQLIESDLVDVNVRLDNYGRTLLHRSAYNLDVDLVKILIKHGVNIRLRDYAGNTALHIAIQSYRNGAVIYDNGTDVVRNLTSIIELLLNADKDLQEERNSRKRIKLLTEEEPRERLVRKPQKSSNNIDLEKDESVSISDGAQSNPFNILSTSMRKVSCKSLESEIVARKQSNPINKFNATSTLLALDTRDRSPPSQKNNAHDEVTATINPILLEDHSSPLIDTKNAFGRTALHYCVLVVGEQHLAHFVKLLISYGADIDITDTRMKTPLYCLVKRPGISAVRQKCLAIKYLLENGCDDLGLAIDPSKHFSDKFIQELEKSLPNTMLSKLEY